MTPNTLCTFAFAFLACYYVYCHLLTIGSAFTQILNFHSIAHTNLWHLLPCIAFARRYVWFDALSNYLTGVDAIEKGAKSDFWPAQCHIIGQDIIWHHCVIWPCMLMSAGITLPETIFGHGFVQDQQGKKMSKSIGNVVDPFDMMESYNVDTLRFFLVRQAPYGKDVKFSEQDLKLVNNELADKYGTPSLPFVKMANLDLRCVF